MSRQETQKKVPEPRQPCGAKTRSGRACKNHPVRGKKRCRMHGGASTGPRTSKGRARIAAIHYKHGKRRRSVVAEQKRRNEEAKKIQWEIEHIEQHAIAEGWLPKDWKRRL